MEWHLGSPSKRFALVGAGIRHTGSNQLSTDAEMNGSAAGPPIINDVEAEPTLPRADAVDGLAHGAVTDAAVDAAAETTVIEIPRLARALRHRDFRLFWTGNFLSNVGTWMQNIAQGWLVLKLTNSAFWLGVVGFSASIPILLFALIGGVIADHVNKRKLLMVTQSAMMTFAFIMAALTWTHHINVYAIVLLALGTGIAMSLNTPSYQALVRSSCREKTSPTASRSTRRSSICRASSDLRSAALPWRWWARRGISFSTG